MPVAAPELSGIVEVDESFFGKQKYGHQTLVAGALERDTRRLRLQVIPDRAQDTLEAFLTATVARNSPLLADYHGGYNDLEFYGYSHERRNHSQKHFGPTNNIENMWGCHEALPEEALRLYPHQAAAPYSQRMDGSAEQPWLFASPQNYLKATVCSGLVD